MVTFGVLRYGHTCYAAQASLLSQLRAARPSADSAETLEQQGGASGPAWKAAARSRLNYCDSDQGMSTSCRAFPVNVLHYPAELYVSG